MNEDIRRTLLHPYWVRDPLKWEVPSANVGIAFFAREGRVGMFNLALLMVDTPEPPPSIVYSQRPLSWIIRYSSTVKIGPRTLEAHASYLELPDFCYLLNSHPDTMRSPHTPVLAHLHDAGLRRAGHTA